MLWKEDVEEEERGAGEKGEHDSERGPVGVAGVAVQGDTGVWGEEKGPGSGGISKVETTLTDARELIPQLTC